MAATTPPHSLLRTCPSLTSAGGHLRERARPRSVRNSSHLLLRPYCVSRRSPLVTVIDCRNEERSSVRSSHHVSSLVASTSISPDLDSKHGTLHSAAAGGASRSSFLSPEAEDGRGFACGPALTGLGFLACAFLFSEVSSAFAAESKFETVMTFAGPEPSNALSLPTWIIHVASVAEWVTAMVLVWKYGDTKGNSAWKGLTWGMVPLLGGAMCACTWHFFYNAESLEVLVVLQAFLTVVGNFTMWAAAYRIWKLSQEKVTVD